MSTDTELGALLSARATTVIDRLEVPIELLDNIHAAHQRHRRLRIVGPTLSIVVVVAGAAVTATLVAGGSDGANGQQTLSASPTPTSYTNARFGYSDLIPANLQPQQAPADGDGQTWKSSDGATLTLSAVNNNHHLTTYDDMTAVLNNYMTQYGANGGADGASSRASSGIATVRTQKNGPGPSTTTTAGPDKGTVLTPMNKPITIYFQRDVVLSNVIYSLAWAYPAAKKSSYEPMVRSTVANFVAGPNKAA
jgi:hypothetical protein